MKSLVKILFISDTHTQHDGLFNKFEMPETDIIVHAGDITGNGSESSVRKFLKWFGMLDIEHKIFIAGNHDRLFENERSWAIQLVNKYSKKYSKIHYLEDNGVELMNINFWGSPVTLPFCNWAFNRPEEKLSQHWEAIPNDIDVLITHDPPYMIKDYASSGSEDHCGSPSLYNEVTNRIKPKIHVFGHIHEQYGISNIGETTFINASNVNERYQLVNPPVLMGVEIDK